MTAPTINRRADIPVCRFRRLSSRLEHRTGKSGEPAGWKACPTSSLPFLAAIWVMIGLAMGFGKVHAQDAATTNAPVVRFRAVDIYIDSKDKPLAAYQLTFSVVSGGAKIVGIEGGDRPAFGEAPYYDPKAMQQERVIIAAFSTNAVNALPTGKTCVATIHLQLSGATPPEYNLKLQAAADADGNRIQAETSVEERKAK